MNPYTTHQNFNLIQNEAIGDSSLIVAQMVQYFLG